VTVPEPAPALSPPAADGRERIRRVLVAGVGNLFFTDDGFGPEAARQLALHEVPDGVRVTDYGIRGMHLALDLLDGWDRLILLDLLPSHGRPGTVRIVEIDPDAVGNDTVNSAAHDPHGMAPHSVLATVGSLGGRLPPTVLVGCEAADVGEGLGLTPAVAAAVRPAVEAVLALLQTKGSNLTPTPGGVPTSGGR
jgi:hydrogenase maturation protease